jgi:hypothetical protein
VTEIIAAAFGALGVIIVSLIGLYGAKRLNIGPNQEKLVVTLKDLIDAQNLKITVLEKQRVEDAERIHTLEKRVEELQVLTVTQAIEINRLLIMSGKSRGEPNNG